MNLGEFSDDNSVSNWVRLYQYVSWEKWDRRGDSYSIWNNEHEAFTPCNYKWWSCHFISLILWESLCLPLLHYSIVIEICCFSFLGISYSQLACHLSAIVDTEEIVYFVRAFSCLRSTKISHASFFTGTAQTIMSISHHTNQLTCRSIIFPWWWII